MLADLRFLIRWVYFFIQALRDEWVIARIERDVIGTARRINKVASR